MRVLALPTHWPRWPPTVTIKDYSFEPNVSFHKHLSDWSVHGVFNDECGWHRSSLARTSLSWCCRTVVSSCTRSQWVYDAVSPAADRRSARVSRTLLRQPNTQAQETIELSQYYDRLHAQAYSLRLIAAEKLLATQIARECTHVVEANVNDFSLLMSADTRCL